MQISARRKKKIDNLKDKLKDSERQLKETELYKEKAELLKRFDESNKHIGEMLETILYKLNSDDKKESVSVIKETLEELKNMIQGLTYEYGEDVEDDILSDSDGEDEEDDISSDSDGENGDSSSSDKKDVMELDDEKWQ